MGRLRHRIETFQILYCKAIVYPGTGDTDLNGHACQHDPKVIVMPFLLYTKIHLVHASVDGACTGAATSWHTVSDVEEADDSAIDMVFGTLIFICVKGQREDAACWRDACFHTLGGMGYSPVCCILAKGQPPVADLWLPLGKVARPCRPHK